MILHSITVDTRERDAQEIASALAGRGVPTRVAALPNNGGGDFRWLVEPETDGQPWLAVTVERKTVSDLLASANDGRLASFTATPSSAVALRVLLLHGDPERDARYSRHDNETPEAIDNLLVSVQTDGIIIIRSANGITALADRLATFWRWTGKDEHGSYRRPALPITEQVYLSQREREAVRNLMSLPGFGERRSRDLYRELGLRAIYEDLLAGEKKRLLGVRGIGKGVVDGGIRFFA